jgi:hypothetical protein
MSPHGPAITLIIISQRKCGPPAFTNPLGTPTIKDWNEGARERMPVTGELIRMMNYVDDIAATLRRIQAGVTGMTEDEKKRLADYMRQADPNYMKMLDSLEKS